MAGARVMRSPPPGVRSSGALWDRGGAVHNLRAYGATGDGVTDETAKIQAAINAAAVKGGRVLIPAGDFRFTGFLDVPAGVHVSGCGYASRLMPDNAGGNTLKVTGEGVTLENFRMEGTTPGGIQIRADGCRVRGVWFGPGVAQCVWLFACSDVLVDGCTFEHTGYGVIQQVDTASDYVRVVNCTAKDMAGDFIEANCTADAPSRAWTIANNHYLGCSSWGVEGFAGTAERRVIGITAVVDVVIAGNIMRHWGGDAAIHLEDVGGECIITGNVLEDGWTSGANKGYVYLLNSAQHVVIAHNIIRQTDATLPAQYAVAADSGLYSNTILIQGNRIAAAAGITFSALNLQNQTAPMIVTGNLFDGLATGIRGNHTTGLTLSGNTFRGVDKGVSADNQGTTGGACNDWTISGNRFASTGTFCIKVERNTNGTNPSQRWLVTGNYFDGDVTGFDTIDILAHGNMIAAGKTLNLGGTASVGSTRYAERDNFVVGTGVAAS